MSWMPASHGQTDRGRRAAVGGPPAEGAGRSRTFCDGDGRTIRVSVDGEAGFPDDVCARLGEMYQTFDSQSRTRSLPPASETGIDAWLEDLFVGDSHHAVAIHGTLVVGHAMLVPGEDDSHEFAIFVRGDYQHAGIGTALRETVLDVGAERGLGRVWLLIDVGNVAALGLCEAGRFERAGKRRAAITMHCHLS
jgi:GNAT superfamily N-acetyltransferase